MESDILATYSFLDVLKNYWSDGISILALVGAGIALWHSYRHNRISVAPKIDITNDRVENKYTVTFMNNGLGPARIKKVVFCFGDVRVDHQSEGMVREEIYKHKTENCYLNIRINKLKSDFQMPSNSNHDLLVLSASPMIEDITDTDIKKMRAMSSRPTSTTDEQLANDMAIFRAGISLCSFVEELKKALFRIELTYETVYGEEMAKEIFYI